MNNIGSSLQHRLQQLRSRRLRITAIASLALGAFGLTLLLAGVMGVDLALELSPALRLMALGAAVLGVAGLVAAPLLRVRAQLQTDVLAESLDKACGAHGEIISGSDLAHKPVQPVGPNEELTGALANLAVQRATQMALEAPLASAAPWSSAAKPLLAAGFAVLAAAGVALLAPRLVCMQWARLIDPFGDHPPYSRVQLSVEPGNASILYGQPLDISVTAHGGTLEEAELVWLPEAQGEAQTLPMFRETSGKWRGTIAEATAPGRYFIRTPSARSHRYAVQVVMVPRIASAEFRITPPAYTRLGSYQGPLPKDGLRGLPGTQVQVTITANRPLAGGTLSITPGQAGAVTPPAVALKPVSAGSNQVVGEFELPASGTLAIEVVDPEGNRSSPPFSAAVTLLKDSRPVVRLVQPEPMSLATPSSLLPVEVSGEDDYGVARLQIFRGLNESRPRPTEIVLAEPRTRADGTKVLPLAAYGLAPGDTLQLFARAEDNDPAGPKGTETAVTTVQIISEAEMQQLLLARAGLETLMGKYQEAQRHVEALKQKLDALEQALEKDPTSELAAKELQETLKKFSEVEKRLDELLEENLPLDLDQVLNGDLRDLALQVSEAKEELLAGSRSGADKAQAVKTARQKLAAAAEAFEDEVTEPLESFAKTYALKEDEGRFVELYQKQKDLADRIAVYRSQAVVEDPTVKARLRDLEEEQQQVRLELEDLFSSIESHITELPEGEQFDALRKSAAEFLAKAKESGVGKTMINAETALAAFAGTDSHQHAQQAAEILKALLGNCEQMGEGGRQGMKFSPGLSKAMDRTIDQLLNAQGLRSVRGMGQGGYSAQRSTLQNVGLYGARPQASQARSSEGSARTNPGVVYTARNAPAEGGSSASQVTPKAVGASGSQVTVPAQYQRRVNDYYQRVADELETKDRHTREKKR